MTTTTTRQSEAFIELAASPGYWALVEAAQNIAAMLSSLRGEHGPELQQYAQTQGSAQADQYIADYARARGGLEGAPLSDAAGERLAAWCESVENNLLRPLAQFVEERRRESLEKENG